MAETQNGQAPGQGAQPVRRVLLVDDHPMMRRAIAGLIEREPDLTVCGEAPDAMLAMELARRRQPDVAIVDLRLKAGHGLEMLAQLCAAHPGIACLVYTMLDEDVYGERAVRAGALGFLSKRASATTVIDAVRTILDGHVYLSPTVATRMLRRQPGEEDLANAALVAGLSDRELAVFELIGDGRSLAQIADQLAISPKTVDACRQRIKRALDVASNEQLVRVAVEWMSRQ